MADKTIIPWQRPDQWEQINNSITHLSGLYKNQFQSVVVMAKQIQLNFEQLSDPIEQICDQTCGACNDICCEHATIWFDLKDLLYVHFAMDTKPESQIEKKQSSQGKQVCCHFSRIGCVLPRIQRPFICTWYFCPSQTQYFKMIGQKVKRQIERDLFEIKMLRKKIELEFIRITGELPDK